MAAFDEKRIYVSEDSVLGENCTLLRDTDIESSTLGKDVYVGEYTKIQHCELGDNVRLERMNSLIYSKIGRFCYTGHNTTIRVATLGSFNSLSWNISIGGNNHDMDKVTTHSFLVYPKWNMGGDSHWKSQEEPCVLQNDIWVGAGSMILRGVTIGNGAIIGGGSVVTKNVEPYTIVVGNPARAIKMRCNEKIAEKMLELEWWNFPKQVIKDNFELFHSTLTEEVVDKLFTIKDSIK